MRGLCAIFVCLFHFRVNSPIASSPFVLASWQFVDFFFVLSGFVIAANYRQRLEGGLSRWRFLALRLGRIYPLHVFVLGLFVLSELMAAILLPHEKSLRPMFDAAHALEAIPFHLLMLQSAGLFQRLTWNGPAWSIAVEFWAYVAFALIVPPLRERLNAVLVAVVIVCPLILFAVGPWGINVTWNWGLVRCFYGFALGVLAWSLWQRRGATPGKGSPIWTAIEVATLVVVVAFVIATGGETRWNLFGPPLFTATVLVFAHERGQVSRALATPPLLFLGTLSYSIYMMHSFVQARGTDVLKLIERVSGYGLTASSWRHGTRLTLMGATPLQGTLLTVLMLIVVVAVSYVTYQAIERPAQLWSRDRFRARKVSAR